MSAIHTKTEPDPEPRRKNIAEGLVDQTEPAGTDPLLAPAKPLPAWAADLPIRNPGVNAPTAETAGTRASGMRSGGGNQNVKVEVNGKSVALPPKPQHVFVDIFDVYPFDLTIAGGKKLISRLNGMDIADYSMPVHAGDKIDLYWEK